MNVNAGHGSFVNEDGKVELEGMIMDGHTLKIGKNLFNTFNVLLSYFHTYVLHKYCKILKILHQRFRTTQISIVRQKNRFNLQ